MFEALLSNRTVSVLVEALPRILTAGLTMTIPLTLVSRLFAILLKTPVTVFLLTGIFPLVPGAGIYYTAYYFIQGENALSLANGISTFKVAVALAVGIALVLGLPMPKGHGWKSK